MIVFPFLLFIIVKYNIGHGYEENCQNLLERMFRETQIRVIHLEILIWHKMPFPPFSCHSTCTQEGKQKVLLLPPWGDHPRSCRQLGWLPRKDTEMQRWACFLSVSVFHFPKALFGSCSDTHLSVRNQSTFASLYFLICKMGLRTGSTGIYPCEDSTEHKWKLNYRARQEQGIS